MLEALRRKKRGCSGFWGLELDFSFQGGLRWVIESGVSKTGWSYRDDRTPRI